jgi:hypothetical protein
MEVKITVELQGLGTIAEAAVPILPGKDIVAVLEDPTHVRYSLPQFTSPDHAVLVWSQNFVEIG